MKKRIITLLCVVSMGAAVLSGCSSGKESAVSTEAASTTPVESEKGETGKAEAGKVETTQQTEEKQEPVEITYWNTVGSVSEREATNAMIKRFEEQNPGITVKYEGMEGEAYKTKIKTVVSANNLPDVFGYWVGEQFKTLVSSGNVEDLTSIYGEDGQFKDSFVPGSLEAVSYDGKTYGAPTTITCMAVWYNKAIFEEHGIEVPKTYEELKNVINELSDQGVTPIIVGAKDRWPLLGWYSYLAQRIGGVELYNEVCSGDKNFTEDAYVQAGEELKALAGKGFINGCMSVDATTAEALFAAGKGAILITGSWSIPTFTENPEHAKDFSYFPFPVFEGGKEEEAGYLYGGVANTMAISKSAKNKEAAIKFLKFMLSEEEQTINVERTGSFSTVKVSPKEENMDPLAYQFSQYVSDGVEGFIPYTDQALPPEQAENLLNALTAIVAGENVDVKAELAKIK